MFATGSRVPVGGRKADTYAPYAGMTAETVQGVQKLFAAAKVSHVVSIERLKLCLKPLQSALALREVARSVHPELAGELAQLSKACDRLGITGSNVYDCDGYMAPMHKDLDMGRGLSYQLLLRVPREHAQFGFAVPQYGYYIVTRTNMAW